MKQIRAWRIRTADWTQEQWEAFDVSTAPANVGHTGANDAVPTR